MSEENTNIRPGGHTSSNKHVKRGGKKSIQTIYIYKALMVIRWKHGD